MPCPCAVLRHHLHHVRQLEGALVHTLHRADVRHGNAGARLGERMVTAGRAGGRGPGAGLGQGAGAQGQPSSGDVCQVLSLGLGTFQLVYL